MACVAGSKGRQADGRLAPVEGIRGVAIAEGTPRVVSYFQDGSEDRAGSGRIMARLKSVSTRRCCNEQPAGGSPRLQRFLSSLVQ